MIIENAACAGLEVDVFYRHEDQRGRAKSESAKIAREICAECPVRQACLDYAMRVENGWSRYGIWGGLTALERAKLANRPAYDRYAKRRRYGLKWDHEAAA